MKVPFLVYADTKSLLDKIDTCHSNPKKPSTMKESKHTACSYSLFNRNKNKHEYYGGEDCMKRFKRAYNENN